jgi:hypothetical protein
MTTIDNKFNDKQNDFVEALHKSIDSFLLATYKMLPKENNGIDVEQILYYFISKSKIIFEKEQNKCIHPYGDILYIKKKANLSYEKSILEILNLIISNENSYDEEFIIKIKKDYNKMEEYRYCEYICDRLLNEPEKFKKINISELQNIQVLNKNNLDHIVTYFYEIETMRNILEQNYDFIIIKSIALYIESLINIIITNCYKASIFYKKMTSIGANLITCELRNHISQNNYYNSITSDSIYFDNYCMEILSNEFEKLFDIYNESIDKIKIFYQHAIALSDKLKIILFIHK